MPLRASRRRLLLAFSLLLLAGSWTDARAQRRDPSVAARPVQALHVAPTWIDFTYAGAGDPRVSFAFRGPAYGLAFSRPRIVAGLLLGEDAAEKGDADQRPRRLVDFSLTTWGEFARRRRSQAVLFVPVALHTGHRRVAREGDARSLVDAFNITVVGLGGGAGLRAGLGPRLLLEARALPVVGVALRSFGDSAGYSWLGEADVQLHTAPVVGRFGLSAGYGFRLQQWQMGSSTLLAEVTQNLYDYRTAQHTLRLGLNW